MLYLNHSALGSHMSEILTEKGVCKPAIEHVVKSLITTSLRGTDSHGVNLFPHYCKAIDSGRINTNPNLTIKNEAKSVAILDADHAFGHHAGAVASDHAVELAKKTGISAVGVKNSSHFGAAAYFGLRMSNEGCLGFAFTNADALVKAHSSKEAFFGTNPICFCAPLLEEPPLCLDMATSLVAWNRIKESRRSNQSVPAEWGFNSDGNNETNPDLVTSLTPIGHYKGFGLGMMIDVLCSTLLGGPISKDILAMYDSPISAKRRIGHFFMAINIASFIPLETFKVNLQSMTNRIREMESINSTDRVMIPGDPEKKNEHIRKTDGIPMDQEKHKEFLQISPKFKNAIV